MKYRTKIAIFFLFGIIFFPRIFADEIKIYENGSVYWIRDWKETEEKINSTTTMKKLVEVNTEMKYIIDSPFTATIGKLIKETNIEGCQYIGCNITLRFGNGNVFHKKRIENSIDKIIIDLGSGSIRIITPHAFSLIKRKLNMKVIFS